MKNHAKIVLFCEIKKFSRINFIVESFLLGDMSSLSFYGIKKIIPRDKKNHPMR